MVKVQDDILHAIDRNEAVVLLMLDLSAAFDTVSHEILLDRLSQCYGSKKYEHITPILIDLHWLLVEYCITYKILLLVYKAINGLSPSYISNLLSFCTSSYSLRSCSNKLLQVPRSKLKSNDDRRFSIAGPKLWNSILASLRNADSLNSFKKHLKTYLIRQAFFDL